MIVTGRHLPRRMFLKGMGAAIALPALDAMTPALAARGLRAAPAPLRLAFTYAPNGVTMADWTPSAAGTRFEYSRILKPLESFALKPTARRLFAPFLFSQLRFPLDHPFAMMLSAGPADSLSVNDDGNGYVGEPRL